MLLTLLKISAVNMVKNFLIVLKKSITVAIKTTSKSTIQKRAIATGDLTGNNIADKITSFSKKSSKNHIPRVLHSQNEDELEVLKERYISPEKGQHIIDELRLV